MARQYLQFLGEKPRKKYPKISHKKMKKNVEKYKNHPKNFAKIKFKKIAKYKIKMFHYLLITTLSGRKTNSIIPIVSHFMVIF